MAFLPFIMKGQIKNILERLFPIKRGLLHAYWAPNFWAIYSSADLFLRRFFILKPEIYRQIFKTQDIASSNLCNGLTGEKSFSVLPRITPLTCVFLIGLFHVVLIIF